MPVVARGFAPSALVVAEKQEVSTVTAQPEVADSSNGGLPASAQASQTNIAPGSIVLVRDEEWLVTDVRTVYERADHRELVPTKPANRIDVVGVSELVRDMTATFFDSIDHVEVLDPREEIGRAHV